MLTETRHVILLAALAVSLLADGTCRAVEVDAPRRDPDTARNILDSFLLTGFYFPSCTSGSVGCSAVGGVFVRGRVGLGLPSGCRAAIRYRSMV